MPNKVFQNINWSSSYAQEDLGNSIKDIKKLGDEEITDLGNVFLKKFKIVNIL